MSSPDLNLYWEGFVVPFRRLFLDPLAQVSQTLLLFLFWSHVLLLSLASY